MSEPTDERVLAFLLGDLSHEENLAMLEALEQSEELAAEVRQAAAGLEAVKAWAYASRSGTPRTETRALSIRRVRAWWVPAAVAATVALTVPVTLQLTQPPSSADVPGTPGGPGAPRSGSQPSLVGAPEGAEPSFVVVLHGRWPDAGTVSEQERARRAQEYWGWTSELARRGLLVAAGDLRWEPGVRLASSRGSPPPASVAEPDFLVGLFAVRASTYEEAQAIAAECPHLDYGGSVSVRRVGTGFVTVPGMDDWSD